MNIIKKFLPINKYNRPNVAQTPARIVIHYTGVAGCDAARLALYQLNVARGVFSDNPQAWTSSQFIVGLGGDIIQSIPCTEISYAASGHNVGSIHIECCHATTAGTFNEKTRAALCELVCYLMDEYHISPENVVRHYDLTGKYCPLGYINADEWAELHREITTRPKSKLYRIQTGAFRQRENAEREIERIRLMGVECFIVEDFVDEK